MCEIIHSQNIKKRSEALNLIVLSVIGIYNFFICCKANLSIIGNAKQVEFTVLLIKMFLNTNADSLFPHPFASFAIINMLWLLHFSYKIPFFP